MKWLAKLMFWRKPVAPLPEPKPAVFEAPQEQWPRSKDPFGDWFALACIHQRLMEASIQIHKLHSTDSRKSLHLALMTAVERAKIALKETDRTKDGRTAVIYPVDPDSKGDWARTTSGGISGEFQITKEPFFHNLDPRKR